MQGLHLTADLHGCSAARPVMTDTGVLRAVCLAAVAEAGLSAVGELFHRFVPPGVQSPAQADARANVEADARADAQAQARADAPSGITGVVLLAESHLAVHTWPELAAATVDVYVCNLAVDNSRRAHALMDALLAALAPTRVERHAHRRG